MVGFYNPSYRRVKELKRQRSTALSSLLLCLACFIMAWTPIPSPFGADLGNDLALACVGASLSVAMVAALDYLNVCHEMLDECWRSAISLHDSCDGGLGET